MPEPGPCHPHPPARLRRRALGWLATSDAVGMARTAQRLLAAGRNPDLESALVHEALLGERLARLGFTVRSEVRARRGKSCDLVAMRGGLRVHFHVKGIHVPGTGAPLLPKALRVLQRIPRRLAVEVEVRAQPPTRGWAGTVSELSAFIRRASISDEHVVRDRLGHVIARCRIRSAHPGRSVVLLRGVEPSRERTRQRIIRALRKAQAQFLSGGENVIVLHGAAASRLSVEDALLGTPIERWDRLPRRRERIALGRAEDGFWQGGAAPESRLVAWVREDAPSRQHELHARGASDARSTALCRELFPGGHSAPSPFSRS